MKIKALALICVILLALIFTATQSAANDLTICRDPNTEWFRVLVYPVDISSTFGFSPAEVGGGFVSETVFVVDGVNEGITSFHINGTWYHVDTTLPYCGDSSDIWQPDAPSIPIEMTTDCAWVEIRDAYDNWHLVYSDGDLVLLHYGEALIGGRNQSTNPEDYRAVATSCY